MPRFISQSQAQSQSQRRSSGRFSPDDSSISLQFPLLNDCGIMNPSNFCYQNALLQALLRTCVGFTLQVFSLSMGCSHPLLLCLRELALNFAHPGARRANPLPDLFSSGARDWSGSTKEDAYEFFSSALIPKLQTDLSFDSSFFTGCAAIKRACSCGEFKFRTEDFSSLLLNPLTSLSHSIKDHLASEQVTVDPLSASICDMCGSNVFKESRTFVSAPDSLIIFFKRSASKSGSLDKIHVNIPDKFSIDVSETRVEYKVSASVEFEGRSLDKGHYFCKIQAQGGRWTLFNDGSAPVNCTVSGKDAYMLICQKISHIQSASISISVPTEVAFRFRQESWEPLSISLPPRSVSPSSSSPSVSQTAEGTPLARRKKHLKPATTLPRQPEPHTALQHLSQQVNPNKHEDFVTRTRTRVVRPPSRFKESVQPTRTERTLPKPRYPKPVPVKLAEEPVHMLTSPEYKAMLPRYNENLRELIENVESCPICHEVRTNLNISRISYPSNIPETSRIYSHACSRCQADLKKNKSIPFRFSAENNMIPSSVPPPLQNLTPVEQALIARISVVMAVYNLRHGSSAARGHVVAIPVDLSTVEIALSLPPANIDVVVISREMYDGSIRDFQVRRTVVRNAIQWLKDNNIFYSDVCIDEGQLDKLPEDGSYPNLNVNILPPDSEEVPNAGPLIEVDDGGEAITSSVLPNVVDNVTEKEKVHRSLDGKALRLMQTPGFLTMAFPVLFPDGKGDCTVPSQVHRPVSLHDYFAHILALADQRLANDRRLPYFLFNTYFRERAASSATVFVARNPEVASLTVADLKDALARDSGGLLDDGSSTLGPDRIRKAKALIRNASSWTSSFPGTRQYWQRIKGKLISMIRQLGHPHLFCSHSFADFHCPDLREFLQRRLNIVVTEENQRDIVLKNPGLVDRFLHDKFKLIFKHFYQDVVGVVDYFIRFEYQGRGAIHAHLLLWLDRSVNFEDANAIGNVVKSLISTWHPDPEYRHEGPHPCKQKIDYLTLLADGSEAAMEVVKRIVHHVQKHNCFPGYCIKPGQQACRFGFPKRLAPETCVAQNADGTFSVTTARNDPRINNFNECLALLTRSNHDIQVVTSLEAAIGYVAKYTSKPEVQSASFKEVATSCLSKCSNQDSVVKFIRLLMNASLVDRDFYQQEVVHIGIGLPLCEFSRTFVTINENESFLINQDDCELKSSVEKYIGRSNHPQCRIDAGSENCVSRRSLWGLNKFFLEGKYREITCWKAAPVPRIVVAFPRLPKLTDDKLNEDWCRVHLTFHKVYSSREEILGSSKSYADEYSAWVLLSSDDPSKDPAYHPETYDDWPLPPRADPQGDRDRHHAAEYNAPSPNGGMAINERRPDSLAQVVDISQFSGQSLSSQVRDFIPNPERLFFPDSVLRNIPFHKESIKTGQCSTESARQEQTTKADFDRVPLLTEKQRLLYDFVAEHFQLSRKMHLPPLRTVVHGTAGTGKSFVIDALVDLLGDVCVRLAPTGVAASNITGQTMHSFASIFPGMYSEIPSKKLAQLQEKNSRIEYIIVDEMSMVGAQNLARFSDRLNSIFPCEDGVLGARSVILFGDFGQLPPVLDHPIYERNPRKAKLDTARGTAIYQMFDSGVVLDQVMRQAASTAAGAKEKMDAAKFMKILQGMRTCNLDDADLLFISSRQDLQLNAEQVPEVIHLFGKCKDVRKHNEAVLRNFENVPDLSRLTFEARTSVTQERKTPADKAVGLEPELTLVIGARVMLTANLNVSLGLVNGSVGTVKGFGYTDCFGMPQIVMVKFEGYQGPVHKDAHGCVGIFPIDKEWTVRKHGVVKRTMIPLRLAWAITIHKSQGLTLPYVVVDLRSLPSNKLKLAFVAISRVKRIENVYILVSEEGIVNWLKKVTLYDTQARAAATRLKAEEVRISFLGLKGPVSITFP